MKMYIIWIVTLLNVSGDISQSFYAFPFSNKPCVVQDAPHLISKPYMMHLWDQNTFLDIFPLYYFCCNFQCNFYLKW